MKKTIWGIVLGLILAGVGYYTLSPLLKNTKVNDELPPSVTEALEPGSIDHLTDAQKSDMMMQIIEANQGEPKMMEDSMPEIIGPSETTEPETTPAPQPQVRGPFAVKDTPLHPASGSVRVIDTEDGTIVRFEDFKTINGPRVHVYLAKDVNASEFIDLGPLRGTEGNINYTVPEGIDLSEYPIVMHWCVPFGVLFNYAEIQ